MPAGAAGAAPDSQAPARQAPQPDQPCAQHVEPAMFSWKRQRKDDGPQRSAPAPVSSTPAAACEIEAALEPPTPSCHADSGAASLPPSTMAAKPAAAATAAAAGAAAVALAAPPGTSIELAARGSDGSVPSVLERASVRTKAAYFEALIHSNTTAHIVVRLQ